MCYKQVHDKDKAIWHVSVMKKDGTYSDKIFKNRADAEMEICYARSDDYSDNVLGLSIWKEFK